MKKGCGIKITYQIRSCQSFQDSEFGDTGDIPIDTNNYFALLLTQFFVFLKKHHLLHWKVEDTKKHNNLQIWSPFGRTDGSNSYIYISD